LIHPTRKHVGVRDVYTLLCKAVREGDSGGHAPLILAIYEIPAFDSLPNPVVRRVLVEAHFLGECGQRPLSNTPGSSTSKTLPNSGDRLPDGGGNRGLDAIRE